MDDAAVIRMAETLNARALALRNSEEYAAGVHKKNVHGALTDLGPAKIADSFAQWQTARRFAKVPRHAPLPNLGPEEWEASLRPGSGNKKVVVYSCIVGNYDLMQEPLYQSPNVDYILYLAGTTTSSAPGWNVRTVPDSITDLGDNAFINRYVKFHPHELFADDYDAAIYIDGNIQPVSDLSYYADLIEPAAGIALHYHRARATIAEEVEACKALGKGDPELMDQQVRHYVDEGYPLSYGLLECNVIATDLHSDVACSVLRDWWDEYSKSGSGRDQLALPYVLWKNHIPLESVAKMGQNAYADTKIYIADHR
ncbi:MAG: DUF616 domain-containing protein [Olegusella sp.]|nr:DUF616 domain-containing protein [Olegusella sp.]